MLGDFGAQNYYTTVGYKFVVNVLFQYYYTQSLLPNAIFCDRIPVRPKRVANSYVLQPFFNFLFVDP